ncbi:MAG TPA: epoxyqueuosine reductase QueH [Lachnospiraceae bacterium]|nr:epoxyqueuosine reductase QueH [Lachnospiraceae bacterium]
MNYQKDLEKVISENEKTGRAPRLLLHSCCAPCSSYVLEYLSPYFKIVDFYYNPNITEEAEYRKRCAELKRLTEEIPSSNGILFVEGSYEPERFMKMAEGYEDCHEGGERCFRCYRMRLEEAAAEAVKMKCDYFTTTLTISPLKNAEKLNEIGEDVSGKFGIPWLPSDFKKRGGYQRSIELSAEHHLYRQNYCGCVFSKRRDCVKLSRKQQDTNL